MIPPKSTERFIFRLQSSSFANQNFIKKLNSRCRGFNKIKVATSKGIFVAKSWKAACLVSLVTVIGLIQFKSSPNFPIRDSN